MKVHSSNMTIAVILIYSEINSLIYSDGQPSIRGMWLSLDGGYISEYIKLTAMVIFRTGRGARRFSHLGINLV